MKWIRALHLGIAVTVPALSAVGWGLSLRLAGKSKRQVIKGMMAVVSALGPRLAGIRIQCKNKALLQCDKPAVYIFNHQSGLDPVIVCALLPQEVVGVAKRSLSRNPVLGPLLRLTNTLFVERGPQWLAYLTAQAGPVIAQGFSIAIAPEGTRLRQESQKQVVGEFRSGAFHLAQKYELPLIPIVIHNSAERLPVKSTQLQSGPVYVSVLEHRTIRMDENVEQVIIETEQRYASCIAAGY